MRKKNKILLMKRAPELVSQEEYFLKNGYEKSEVIPSKSGHPTLKYHTEDGEVFVHSAYDPEREAERISKELEEIDSKAVIVFLGVGLGYTLSAVAKRFPENEILLWEPEPEFLYRWWDTLDIDSGMWDRLLGLSTEMETIVNRLRKPEIFRRGVRFVSTSFHETVFSDQIENFFSSYNKMMLEEREDFLAGLRYYDRQILSNMKNMGRILSSPSVIQDNRKLYQGQSVILVSAGPSLNVELENLKCIFEKGTAMIIACGSSIHTLLNNGIIPHALVAIDAGLGIKDLIQPIKDQNCKDISLFFADCAGYEGLDGYPGKMYWLDSDYGVVTPKVVKHSGVQAKFSIFNTVANTALELVIHLGFSKIVLVGQNLALWGTKRYAKDISYYEDSDIDVDLNRGVIVECESVDGEIIKTLFGYETMRKEMENLISLHPEVMVYNTTKGGASIRGTTYVALSELLTNLLVKSETLPGMGFEVRDDSEISRTHMKQALAKFDAGYNLTLKLLEDFLEVVNKIENAQSEVELNDIFSDLNDKVSALQVNIYVSTFLIYSINTHMKILASFVSTIATCKSLSQKRQMMKERYGYFYHLLFATYVEFLPHYEEFRKTLLDYIETEEKRNV